MSRQFNVVELAGEYADTFALRSYDSVQLASARILQEASGDVYFAAYDTRPPPEGRQNFGNGLTVHFVLCV
jgi:hypothetical protein